jgi:O-antigen biosynthesis protein
MPRLLILGYVWPEPRSSAAGSRILQLMNCFRDQAWDLTFASAASRSPQAVDLSSFDARDVDIALNCSSFDRFIADLKPDVVIFDRFVTEEQFGWRVANTCPGALRILDTEDLHSLRWARQELLKQQQSGLTEADRHRVGPVTAGGEQLFQVMAASDIAQREVAAIYRSDLTLMISDFECALLQKMFGVPSNLLQHIPFMPDSSASGGEAFASRDGFVTIGNFRHPPNWDAVLWLKHHLWPLLRERLPGAQLRIYGAYQPAKATALHNPKQGFHVCGWAEDAHQVMARARVCLAPLRFGAGLKGKLLDALLCETPSVTSRIGVEGMNGELPWAGAVADEPEAWTAAAVELHCNERAWTEARERGRAIVAERFNARTIGQDLMARVHELRTGLEQHRRANFVGAMLNHHLHKSTQYMAQWIEAKNRRCGSD